MEDKQETNHKITSFTQLRVWQEGHQLVLAIYRLTRSFPKEELFGLVGQLRRAAVSVTSNIAEGFSRNSYKEKIQFYSMALGSLTEIQNQLFIVKDISYLALDEFEKVYQQTIIIHKMTTGLIRSSRSVIRNSKFVIRGSSQENGSIFLEVLITLGILSVATVGLLLAILYGVELNLRAEQQTLASELAAQELEIIRHLPVTSLPYQTNGPLLGQPEPDVSRLPGGVATVSISDVDGDPNTKQVVVQVQYRFGQQFETVTEATIMTAGGLNG